MHIADFFWVEFRLNFTLFFLQFSHAYDLNFVWKLKHNVVEFLYIQIEFLKGDGGEGLGERVGVGFSVQ
jgi:hypothetical protein